VTYHISVAIEVVVTVDVWRFRKGSGSPLLIGASRCVCSGAGLGHHHETAQQRRAHRRERVSTLAGERARDGAAVPSGCLRPWPPLCCSALCDTRERRGRKQMTLGFVGEPVGRFFVPPKTARGRWMAINGRDRSTGSQAGFGLGGR
jgi:hypothetical protein